MPAPAAAACALLPLLLSGNVIWSSSASHISPVVSFTNTARMMLPQRATATCWPVLLLYTFVVKLLLIRAAAAWSNRHSGYGTVAAAAAASGGGVVSPPCWLLELSLLLSSPQGVMSVQQGTSCLAAGSAAPKEPGVGCAVGIAGTGSSLGVCCGWQALSTATPAHGFAVALWSWLSCRLAGATKLGTVFAGTGQD